ncbi:MAG: 8-oxo-dGTP diphosphatase MutT [Candidatus Rokubacteria bacterium]|nr:8-oxo-dGTP diphosphatase MutT [Candidatus Rokubacteria bacterium]MBI2527000.1 8-oxo-dGTP diphosphatase MutT [Candidatus Rokubacteria bacterium]
MQDLTPVVAAVIERADRLLITRRPEGSHLAGLWEFPGGKPHVGESLEDALRREAREELGAEVTVLDRLDTIDWAYPDKRVRLVFFRCTMQGEPRALEGQEMAWVARADLCRYDFPAADAALIARLSGR